MVAWSLTSSGQFFHWSWKDLFPEMVQRIPNLEALMEKTQTRTRGTAARLTIVEQTAANGTENISNKTKKQVYHHDAHEVPR